GSGKTTLLNIIGAIDYPTSGRVMVMDVPVGDYDESFRANFRLLNTGFVFQSYNLISTLTAIENVMFPMQLVDVPVAATRARASKLLEQVGLEERHDHLPYQLSAGEQQRVAIARAMANDPPLILADEPTANLDERSAEHIRRLLMEFNQLGKTVIVITHDSEITRRPGARVFTMKQGELKADV
ncbi:MAG: ABC transporter ATP-binding protein, partial [Candidatus Thorarchaeota archaeon]|nr:ABC transporter ATP-binding protein [Candidatus Thorarchaeota archaeon]